MSNRRSFLQRAFGLGAGWSAGLLSRPLAAQRMGLDEDGPASASAQGIKHGRSGPAFNVPCITTDVGDMPWTMDGSTKVFHLVAQVIRRQIAPDKTVDLWGFNGSSPGPTFQVTQGDHVRVVFDNQLPEPCSIHWHGFEDLIGFDGMPGISQEPTRPGERFVYEFDIHQAGTFFYHSHMAMQEMAGMLGAFIMHPRQPYRPHCDKDFVLHFQEYAVLPNNTVPNVMNMEFNWLVLNGKAGPAATPLIVRQGDRVRLRMVNLGMDHHPIHVHGHTFYTTGTEGGRIPETAWWPGNTVLLGVAQARDVEFVANNPGDWMLHCHLPHHMMNQMSSQVSMGISDHAMSNGPLSERANARMMRGMQDAMKSGKPAMADKQMEQMMSFDMSAKAMGEQSRAVAPNANNVPNFPQDAYMEGPMMNMEHTSLLQRPENDGLRAGWSASMQGMMTFLRVLPPDKYNAIVASMRDAKRANDPYASLWSAPAHPGMRSATGGRG